MPLVPEGYGKILNFRLNKKMHRLKCSSARFYIFNSGFTLIELLVVISIISLLMGILLPVLSKARQQTKLTMCAANLRQVGLAIQLYAEDYNGDIPFGPSGRPVTGSNFYTVTGDVTSLLSLEDGAPVGLGLLLKHYLAYQPKVIFCPGADQPSEAQVQLARVGSKQAQSDFYYRHASVALLTGKPDTYHIRLSDLGRNSKNKTISALVTDVQFLAHPSLASFQVKTRTSHKRQKSNVLFADTHVNSVSNRNDELTVNVGTSPYDALDKILNTFETLDNYR
jgi:prepilin-type N-terminal cleavage/methylation domain-containing protein/prepilin-type processing-associated H-X9-DG protein